MENIFNSNKEYWKKEVVRGNLIWPDTNIIKFANRNFKKGDRENVTILDFGCGAGRNAIALKSEGFNVIAMDYNEDGLKLLQSKTNENIKCIVNEGINVSLEDKSVDAIVASGSLMYCDKKERIQLLKNLRNVLKDEGLMWADWRSQKDSLYKAGKLIEEDYYKLGENSDGRNGVAYYFASKEELIKLYEEAVFSIVSIDEFSYTENSGKTKCSWYHVVARK